VVQGAFDIGKRPEQSLEVLRPWICNISSQRPVGAGEVWARCNAGQPMLPTAEAYVALSDSVAVPS